MSELPPGFVLDQQPVGGGGPALPPGFQLDAPPSRAAAVATDVAKSAGSGLAKGAIGVAGLPGAIEDATNWLARQSVGRVGNYMRGQGFTAPSFQDVEARRAEMGLGSQKALPSAEGMQKAVEGVTGEFYKPQTVAGQYAGTIGEFLPGMALPGGTLMQRALQAIVPAVTSETAGQMTKGTAAEPYVRAAGAIIPSIGISGAQAFRAAPANKVLEMAVGRNISKQAVDDAEALIRDAARGPNPVTLTWDEALNKVTNGAVNLGNVRLGAQGNVQGGAILNPVMAQRPQQIAAAAQQQFNQITPASQAPYSIGRSVGTAAEQGITDVRGAINAASDPLYSAAASVRLPASEMAKITATPGWAEASSAVRNNPQLARYVQGMPDDSVGFLNEVKKYLDTASTNAAGPMNAQRNQQIAAGYGNDAALVRQTAEAASPEYAQALAFQSQAREKYLQPLLDGPLGKLANKDTTTKEAIATLFPKQPLENSAGEISRTMTALASKNPTAAKEVTRAYLGTAFAEATKDLQPGANQMGGAKFAQVIKGNAEQEKNLEAAIKALPNGDTAWTGFNRFLDIMDATGKRPAVGSNTAEKLAMQDVMKGGSLGGEVANAVGTAGLNIPKRLRDWYQQMQAGKNSEQLANILLDPKSAGIFRALASDKVSVPASVALATRLTYMGERGASQPSPNPSR